MSHPSSVHKIHRVIHLYHRLNRAFILTGTTRALVSPVSALSVMELKYKLSGLLYCEFDNVKGSTIMYQYPPGYISKDEYDKYSKFFLTTPKLCHKLITLQRNDRLFIGIPEFLMTTIKGTTYERNAFFFNVVFVFEDVNTTQQKISEILLMYGPVLRKFNTNLSSLEYTKEMLTSKTKNFYKNFENFFHEINETGMANITFDETTSFHFKISPSAINPPPPVLKDHYVPYPLIDLEKYSARSDLSFQRIIPFLDGKNWIKKISQMAAMDLEIVKQIIRHLLFYKVVTVVDIFQYSNVYVLKNKKTLIDMFSNRKLKTECLNFVRGKVPAKKLGLATSKVSQILKLYSRFSHSHTLKLVLYNADNVNHRALVMYGLLKGFLVRIHDVPVLSGSFLRILKREREKNKQRQEAQGKKKQTNPEIVVESRIPSPEETVLRDEHENNSNIKYQGKPATYLKRVDSLRFDTLDTRFLQDFRSRQQSWNSGDEEEYNYEESESSSSSEEDGEKSFTEEELVYWVDGTHCLEEICCHFSMGRTKMVEILEKLFKEKLIFIKREIPYDSSKNEWS